MHAEVIAIGDEITSGQALDTNSQWLSRRLGEAGVDVLFHTSVGDQLEACVDVFRTALRRADVVVTTGGLGPTDDDLTREAIAAATGRELQLNPAALEHIRALFARRRREMPERNQRQAYFPAGAAMISNPDGTAPGIDLTVNSEDGGRSRLFALPGVPAEMKQMWAETVAGAVTRFTGGGRVICHRAINCFGAGESQIEAMLPALIRRGQQPRVGINASEATIILRIAAEGASEVEALATIEPTARLIREKLGSLVFGKGDDRLQDVVMRLLEQQGRTLATAEWGTGGLVASWLGEAGRARDDGPPANGYLGGVVVRSETALHELLTLPRATAGRHPPEDTEMAAVMATVGRERFGADYGLAVGPFPPPGAEAEVHVAVATPTGVQTHTHPHASHPAMRRILCAKVALNLLRLELIGE